MTALDSTQRARHRTLATQLRPAVVAFEELPDGYAARFARTAERFGTLAEFMALEALCCPFFTLALEAACDGGPLRLRITGPDGVKPFIRAEFGIDAALDSDRKR
jgi:hypothetical protein